MEVPADAPAGSLVGVAQFARDARGPPLAVGRMATDSNNVNQSVTKGKAVIILHTWKDHLWSIGSKGEPPEAVSASAVGDHTSVGDGEGGDDGGDLGADAPPGSGQDPDRDRPADVKDMPVAGAEEVITPEGSVLFTSNPLKSGSSSLEVSARLRCALLQALRTTLADLPTSAFPMPTTTIYTAHILPARPFTRTVTTPVDIKHSTYKSLSAFLRTAEKGGLLKLKDARPDVVVVTVYPTHADVVAHRLYRTVGEEDERRRRTEEREAKQAADAANAEKSMTVTELWKPHLGTLPLFGDLGLE